MPAMSNINKILVCGDVNGKVKELYSRVSKILKTTGSFDILFCVGNFFGHDITTFNSLKDGSITVPLPTYVVCPLSESLREHLSGDCGTEICENLTYLGDKGMYTTMTGLRIVYVSSGENPSDDGQNFSSTFLSDTMPTEDIGFLGVDLLLTTQWPAGVDRKLNGPFPDDCRSCCDAGQLSLSKLAYILRPRYHFTSGKGFYYERPPYRNHNVLQEKANHVTRFIALADVKNPLNRKYIYAIQLVSIDKMERQDLIFQPPDVTENPYRNILESEDTNTDGKETEVQTEQYFYACKPQTTKHGERRPQKKRIYTPDENCDSGSNAKSNKKSHKKMESLQEKLEKPREQAACWFCLGNPEVKKHLVVSVNNQAYLALPRGPLVTDHVLILTVGHHRSWIASPGYVRADIEDYKKRLRRMFSDQGKAMVAFERNLKTQHYQLQVVPIPFSVAGEVKQTFLDLFASSDTSPCTLKPIPRNTELEEICSPGVPYFYVELPTGEKLFGQIPKDRISTADIQFGRMVLCSPRILNCPDRVDWRNCIDDVDRETELTKEMRTTFTPYDVDS